MILAGCRSTQSSHQITAWDGCTCRYLYLQEWALDYLLLASQKTTSHPFIDGVFDLFSSSEAFVMVSIHSLRYTNLLTVGIMSFDHYGGV